MLKIIVDYENDEVAVPDGKAIQYAEKIVDAWFDRVKDDEIVEFVVANDLVINHLRYLMAVNCDHIEFVTNSGLVLKINNQGLFNVRTNEICHHFGNSLQKILFDL